MISIRKRGNVYQYCFDAGKVNGKRKQITKSGKYDIYLYQWADVGNVHKLFTVDNTYSIDNTYNTNNTDDT